MKLVAVKLTEVPVGQRMAAARREARRAASEQERIELFVAAMFPSGKTYYVRAA